MPVHRRRLIALAVTIAVLIATPLAVVAADRFADVPDSNVHHNDITWLADAGVTLGCNPPANTNYCPDQAVRRDQMASFLRRLAENQVVDAGTLDGEDSTSYRSIAVADVDNVTAGSTEDALTEINQVTINAPAPGIVIISGNAFLRNQTGGEAPVGLRPTINGDPIGTSGNGAFVVLASGAADYLAYTVAVEVPAGTHEVTQSASALDLILGLPAAGSFFYNGNSLTATWHPEGSVSVPTAGGAGSLLGD